MKKQFDNLEKHFEWKFIDFPEINFLSLPRFWWKSYYYIKDKRYKRTYRHFIQRRRGGFDDSDTYSLDHTVAKFILPRLKRFKEVNNGFPAREEASTFEDWDQIIDKMIFAFEVYARGAWNKDEIADELNISLSELESRCQEGLILFGKWYRDLWW